ncbi:MAG: VCBS repeat-containing protein [Gammaproteobacteria bacterium]|nr:VCBS repeat-containing protein [Gammaproteobacteria bacterium]
MKALLSSPSRRRLALMRNGGRGRPRSRLLLFAAALVVSGATLAQNYTAFELQREDNWDELVAEDVNGDGRADLLYAEFRPGVGRELLIHHQRADGGFAAEPARVEIKSEIVAVGFADLRPDPGKELLLYAADGVYSLASGTPGYAGNIRQLFAWELIAPLPDRERVRFVRDIADRDGDGHIDLLVPGADAYGYFRGLGGEGFAPAAEIATENPEVPAAVRDNFATDVRAQVGIDAERGIVLDFSAETPTAFGDFIEQWDGQPKPALFEAERWMPGAFFAELNGDGLADLAYANQGVDGHGQLNIHYQQAGNRFNGKPDWRGAFDARGGWRLADLDGDGRDDLVQLLEDGDDWDARFYPNTGGGFDLANPAQVLRFGGYDLRIEVVVINGETALAVTYFAVPAMEAIRNTGVQRVTLLYGGGAEDGQLFARRPAMRLEESFSVDNVRGLAEPIILGHDLDGDGRSDALYVTERGMLAARRVGDGLQIDSGDFWEYISPRSVFRLDVAHFNSDGRPDFILRHGTASTVLVSAP